MVRLYKSRTKKSKDNWETPPYFFDLINQEFHFTLDPASDELNHKCERYFTINEDGLKQNWDNNVVFINPPYNKKGIWIRKCYEESIKSQNITIALLIPVTTETEDWHQYIWNNKADEIRFYYKRINFIIPIDADSDIKNCGGTFPPCLIIYRKPRKFLETKISYCEHR